MTRRMLNNKQWSVLKPILLLFAIYDKRNLRTTIEGILFRLRTGISWRDLPPEFGKWQTVYSRFRDWSKKGIMQRILAFLAREADNQCVFIDGSYVKAHQHCSGARRNQKTAIGKSRCGNTSKIHLAVDTKGMPVAFEITGGQINDCVMANDVIDKVPPSTYVVGDKGYDSEKIRQHITTRGSTPVIPRRKGSKKEDGFFHWSLYAMRHLVEKAFARLKHFCGVAMRKDKLKECFSSSVALACCMMWLGVRLESM